MSDQKNNLSFDMYPITEEDQQYAISQTKKKFAEDVNHQIYFHCLGICLGKRALRDYRLRPRIIVPDVTEMNSQDAVLNSYLRIEDMDINIETLVISAKTEELTSELLQPLNSSNPFAYLVVFFGEESSNHKVLGYLRDGQVCPEDLPIKDLISVFEFIEFLYLSRSSSGSRENEGNLIDMPTSRNDGKAYDYSGFLSSKSDKAQLAYAASGSVETESDETQFACAASGSIETKSDGMQVIEVRKILLSDQLGYASLIFRKKTSILKNIISVTLTMESDSLILPAVTIARVDKKKQVIQKNSSPKEEEELSLVFDRSPGKNFLIKVSLENKFENFYEFDG